MIRPRVLPFLIVCVIAGPNLAQAQTPSQASPPQTLTLDQAIQYATDHYPTVRAALEQVNASAAGVDVARCGLSAATRLDSGNRTAPRRTTSSDRCCRRGSSPRCRARYCPRRPARASGAARPARCFRGSRLTSGCGMRRGRERAGGADAGTRRRDADSSRRAECRGLRIPRRASLRSGRWPPLQADLDRRNVLLQSVQDPRRQPAPARRRGVARGGRAGGGSDDACIQAQQTLTIAQATLIRVLGRHGRRRDDRRRSVAGATSARGYRACRGRARTRSRRCVRRLSIKRARRKTSLRETDFPRVFVQSSVFARGSGADPSGVLDGGVDGLGLDRANWAAGVQILFPNHLRLFESAGTEGGGGRIGARERRALRRSAPDDHEPAADRRGAVADDARDRGQYARSAGGGATKRDAGAGALRCRTRHPHRSGRCAESARAGGSPGSARARRRLARAPGRRRRTG